MYHKKMTLNQFVFKTMGILHPFIAKKKTQLLEVWNRLSFLYKLLLYLTYYSYSFIGLVYDSGTSNYRWSDNTLYNFTGSDFTSDLSIGYCVAIYQGVWRSTDCSSPYFFICKLSPTIPNNNLPYINKDYSIGLCPTCSSCTSKCEDGWAYFSKTNSCYKVRKGSIIFIDF